MEKSVNQGVVGKPIFAIPGIALTIFGLGVCYFALANSIPIMPILGFTLGIFGMMITTECTRAAQR